MSKILDCVKFVESEKVRIKSFNLKPKLVVINASSNEASNIYVRNKEKLCLELGFNIELIKYDETVLESEIISKIMELNNNREVNGIIVQLPLFEHLNKDLIINVINPIKDMDGLTVINKGLLVSNTPMYIPCTALGIVNLLEYYNIDLNGKNVVIIGRSELVGLPLFNLLLNNNATVTMTHSKTKDITLYTKQADILIVAIGKPKYIKSDMIKKDAIIIDVGINKVDNKICGDVDFDDVYSKCSYITKVPSGIGIVTTITLMSNVLNSCNIQKNIKQR